MTNRTKQTGKRRGTSIDHQLKSRLPTFPLIEALKPRLSRYLRRLNILDLNKFLNNTRLTSNDITVVYDECKRRGRNLSWPILRFSASIYLEGLKKTGRQLSQYKHLFVLRKKEVTKHVAPEPESYHSFLNSVPPTHIVSQLNPLYTPSQSP
jgi:hypothetical protein